MTPQHDAVAQQNPISHGQEAAPEFAQFGKRTLDKMEWLAPLVNNRLGKLLRIQLRHEHLFFIQGDRITEEIGFGEKGQRFRERDMGKPMETIDDLKKQGYWLVPPRLDAASARQALSETDDGAYYSLFSNQCQDWAHRVRKRTLKIQRARGLADPLPELPLRVKKVQPTVPAGWYLGMIAIGIGCLGLLAPEQMGLRYLKFVGLLLAGMGLSDVIYAFASKEWSTTLMTLLTGLLTALGGVAVWSTAEPLASLSTTILALVLAVIGLMKAGVALCSRPFLAWSGTFLAGLAFLTAASVAWVHREGQFGVWILGATLSGAFILAGFSNIWLNFRLRATGANADETDEPILEESTKRAVCKASKSV